MSYIYEKAMQKIDDRKRLGKFETELEKFDKLYMDTKAKDGDGHDVRKDFIQLDDKLRSLLEKYELASVLDAFKMKRKLRNEQEMANSNLVLSAEKFADPKLQKLWDGALIAKFGPEELTALHGDLKEAERKIAEYHDALQDFNKVPHENSIHFDRDEIIDQKNQRLKDAHKKMSTHLEEVHQRVTNEKYSPFEDTKVKKLWNTAQANANLTAHDLEILQQELLHFEQQIKKLNFHKEELKAIREITEHTGKATVQNLEHGELEAKHERMSRKLKKLETYIEGKVRHSEL
ncbi:unnamed protein product, partial [Mesorhabditis belari]|uniref:Alpha-2-macroglobulin RAP C-terminal domain-containing protein n=1 Tax=Mesorhabditis belari TaxID=2138241 RepID=A0AAF3JC98_9BILA